MDEELWQEEGEEEEPNSATLNPNPKCTCHACTSYRANTQARGLCISYRDYCMSCSGFPSFVFEKAEFSESCYYVLSR